MQFIKSIFNKSSLLFDTEHFTPKFITTMRDGYTRKTFLNDLVAGVTVGVISLPLVMAFAIGSGVDPEKGLFTAIVAGFLISLLGGSRVLIAGPTGAYVVIVYEIVQRHGYEGLALATLLAALILIILGLTKCGTYIRFIPYPVTTGFTTGIAAAIFVNQIKDLVGLKIPHPSTEFFARITDYWHYKDTLNGHAFLLAAITLGIIILCRRISKVFPGAIIAVTIATCIAYFFDFPVDTIEKKFGAIPSTLPWPSFPKINLDNIQVVFPDAITIALLGAIESLLGAVVADGMTGFRHLSNLELIAQGIGNIGSVIFGGIPATGAIARTTASVQLNATTPVAGMINAVTIFVMMIVLAPLASKIPLATLAATLIFIAYNMAEFDHFRDILKGPKSDSIILLTTFSLTVFIDLTVAVQAGVLIAAFLFLKHMSEKTTVRLCKLLEEEENAKELHGQTSFRSLIPEQVQVFEIDGPFFFGVSDLLNEALRRLNKPPRVFILRMPQVPLVDGSGMQALKLFYTKCRKAGIEFFITEVRPDVMLILQKTSVRSTLGSERFIPTLHEALTKSRELVNGTK